MKNNENVIGRDKLIQRLNKLKALAERGIEGERTSAQSMLKKLSKKYKISVFDLLSDDIREYELSYPNDKDASSLYTQIISSVTGVKEVQQIKYSRKLIFTCNNSDYIEICEKCKYFWKKYMEEKRKFMIAFYSKHNLFPKNSKSDKCEYTEEELQDIRNMMTGLKKADYINSSRQITTGDSKY